jgi:streptogrisin C
MSLNLKSLSTVAALFVGVAVGHAEAAAPDNAPSPELLSAMQRDLGLSEEQAMRRVAYEEAAMSIQKTLKAELSDRFGGAWMNKDGTQLFVGVTNEADAAIVRNAGAEPKMVARTMAQLESIKAELDGRGAEAGPDIYAWYVDVTTNSVIVEASDAPAAKESVGRFAGFAGMDAGAVQVRLANERPRPLYELVGGHAYYINGTSRCSIGFAVTVGGFVTAGHCGRSGYTTTGYNRVSQGTFRGSSFPGNDYAWVQTNSSWTPTSKVAGTANRVTGSSVAAVGSSICRSGSTTGWRCGSVQALNATVNYSQGSVYGLTRTSVCAEPGDSGGSFITGTQAQGVTSGGSGNCSTGGTTYFQPVNEILSVYGLSLTKG